MMHVISLRKQLCQSLFEGGILALKSTGEVGRDLWRAYVPFSIDESSRYRVCFWCVHGIREF